METKNFAFLMHYHQQLGELASLAEKVLYIDAGSCLIRLRSFAEEMVKTIYQEEKLPRIPQANFYDLLQSSEFKNSVDNSLYFQLDYLRREGNRPAHGAIGKLDIAKQALKITHQLAVYMAVRYGNFPISQISTYIEPLANPTTEENHRLEELEAEQLRLQETIAKLEAERLAQAKTIEMLSSDDLALRKLQSSQVANSLQWDEATTRRNLIDGMLANAGWNLQNTEEVEFEHKLTNFKGTPSGKGAVDYVLWDSNGKPLAVLEAKKTGVSVQLGREQARLYADALQEKFGQRPVIFYSNGYEIYIWDDCVYNTPRQLYNFYDKESLQKLFFQRQYKQDLTQNYLTRCSEIAERPYQTIAIKTVGEHFQNQRRAALIVQATGTGKTRVAIALTYLLLEKYWAKRVLFLCDRRELRSQASDNFTEHLSTEPRCIIGETSEIDHSARVFISTYPAMMNRFAQLNTGYFDLIIADESHRSIYNKYGDIFEYFDALKIGLTATPVSFISRNTYELFGCENQTPTFSFGLEEAWEHEPPYLARYEVREVTTAFLREGLRYSQLTAEQKRQLEEDLGEEMAQNADFESAQIGRDIFSYDTDAMIIDNLMKNGLRAQNGIMGKTIIFAQNQKHAEHLEKVFCDRYPQFGTKMCKVIHNKIQHVDRLITEFKQQDNPFRIAISVDMLDTGIDVPSILNLVFAKAVRSKVKFWQMIGRGTRLCPALLEGNQDKYKFVIFDHYQNFSYFEEQYRELEDVSQAKPLFQSRFDARLAFAKVANQKGRYFDKALELLKQDIFALPLEAVAVKKVMQHVVILRESDALVRFDAHTQHCLEKVISPLMAQCELKESEIQAVRFDRLIAKIQALWLDNHIDLASYKTSLMEWLSQLALNLDVVRKHQVLIERLQQEAFWQEENIAQLEDARLTLRHIMKYRVETPTAPSWIKKTKTEDGNIEVAVREPVIPQYGNGYRQQFKSLLAQFEQHPVLQKIRQNQQVSKEEIESLFSLILAQHPNIGIENLLTFYGETVNDLNHLLKTLVGLDNQAISRHFSQFTKNHPNLSALQVRFLDLLQSFIAKHGGITKAQLFEEPFSTFHLHGIDGIFDPKSADEVFELLTPYFIDEQLNQRISGAFSNE